MAHRLQCSFCLAVQDYKPLDLGITRHFVYGEVTVVDYEGYCDECERIRSLLEIK